MEFYKLGEIEMKFAEIIWENEPLTSRELTVIAEEKLTWNRSTTYTILRKLCQKGYFQNENAVVISKMSKEEYKLIQSEQFVVDTFEGSLPSFLASFIKSKKLSRKDIEEIKALIESTEV
ncbi:MAG: BlaI/MecI/CopY family transcriptional regulator [Clostridia bacterium]